MAGSRPSNQPGCAADATSMGSSPGPFEAAMFIGPRYTQLGLVGEDVVAEAGQGDSGDESCLADVGK